MLTADIPPNQTIYVKNLNEKVKKEGVEEQENDEDVQEQDVPKKQLNKADKKSWTTDEEVALAKAWIDISTCENVRNEQNRDGFWKRILEHFQKNVRGTTRTHHSLNTKWRNMNAAMSVFNGLFIQQKRLQECGCSDIGIMKNALVDYDKKTCGKSFTHIQAWEIVRQHDKWLEQSCVGQGSSSHSDKRRKSLESGNYESASNDNLDAILSDLNDGTTPAQQRKDKKKDSEPSSKASGVVSFDTYMAKKTQLLEEAAEKKHQKRELTEKLLVAQLCHFEEKTMFQEYKFFNQPHDNITDPNMLAWTLAKKREFAKKHGWTCSF